MAHPNKPPSDAGDRPVEYTFAITIDVRAPPDDPHLRALIDDRLTRAGFVTERKARELIDDSVRKVNVSLKNRKG